LNYAIVTRIFFYYLHKANLNGDGVKLDFKGLPLTSTDYEEYLLILHCVPLANAGIFRKSGPAREAQKKD